MRTLLQFTGTWLFGSTVLSKMKLKLARKNVCFLDTQNHLSYTNAAQLFV